MHNFFDSFNFFYSKLLVGNQFACVRSADAICRAEVQYVLPIFYFQANLPPPLLRSRLTRSEFRTYFYEELFAIRTTVVHTLSDTEKNPRSDES